MGVYYSKKEDEVVSDPIVAQQLKDREEWNQFPKGVNKPISWCSEHDCRMGTCFPLHYPNSLSS